MHCYPLCEVFPVWNVWGLGCSCSLLIRHLKHLKSRMLQIYNGNNKNFQILGHFLDLHLEISKTHAVKVSERCWSQAEMSRLSRL